MLEAIQNLSDLGEGLISFFVCLFFPEQETKNILLFGHLFRYSETDYPRLALNIFPSPVQP